MDAKGQIAALSGWLDVELQHHLGNKKKRRRRTVEEQCKYKAGEGEKAELRGGHCMWW